MIVPDVDSEELWPGPRFDDVTRVGGFTGFQRIGILYFCDINKVQENSYEHFAYHRVHDTLLHIMSVN